MTSNVGTRKLKKGGTMGFLSDSDMEDYEAVKAKVIGAMKQLFNPEFVNRLDESIVFKSLEREDIENIVNIMMDRVNKRIAERNIHVKLTEAARQFLVEEGYDSEYGARPMRRTIQRYIEDPLSQLIIEGNSPEGELEADLDEDKKKLTFTPVETLADTAT